MRTLSDLIGRLGPLFGISVLLILATGLYMALSAWSIGTGWIAVALTSLVLVAPLGTALIEPRRRAIDRLAREADDGSLPPSLQRRTHDPLLLAALQTVAAILLGIVFLMTTKPALMGALIVMTIALVLGVASGVLVARAMRIRGQDVAAEANRTSKPVG